MTDTDPIAGWFGDRPVAPEQKATLVRGVFSRVARRYDLMNDLMSGGIHRLWKDRFVALLRPRPAERLLDVAGGTGDIAFRWRRAGGGPVTVVDINAAMVGVGRDRALDRGLVAGLDWVVGDAERLPLPDASVDAYTIAFGLRNVTHIDAALREAARVLRPGGRFACLEFSRVQVRPLAAAYETWSRLAIPRIGALVARDRESYDYLVESIRRFPPQGELAARMQAAGLARPTWETLTGGIAAIHRGWRV